VKPVLASKQFGAEEFLSGLVVDAALGTMSEKGRGQVSCF